MKLCEAFRVSGRNAHGLKHGASHINQIKLVAPTGFEPVFESRRASPALSATWRVFSQRENRQTSNVHRRPSMNLAKGMKRRFDSRAGASAEYHRRSE